MRSSGSRRSCLVVASFSFALASNGCDTPPRQGPRPAPRTATAAGPTAAPIAGTWGPAAAWRDRTLTWDDLRPALAELGGATAIRDAFLDFRIEQALAERGITLDASATARERTLLVASLDQDPNVAARLLEQIRQREGLGPTRFEALLTRNAGLRALVAAEIKMTPEAVARQHEILHGSKRVCRIIAVQSLQEADALKREIDAGARIADLAARSSTDASAARGGLLAPISRNDPTWPQAFRDALYSLGPNQVSPPTLVDTNYLVIQLIEERPADGTSLDAARAAVEESLRRSQERVLMEEKARGYLAEIQPTIYDSALDGAWRRSKQQ